MIQVREYQDWVIQYNPSNRQFVAIRNGEAEAECNTEDALIAKLKTMMKDRFDPIPVFKIDYGYEGEKPRLITGQITSFNRDEGAIWVTLGGRRRKDHLYGGSGHLLATPENLETAKKMMALGVQRKQLAKQIEELGESMAKANRAYFTAPILAGAKGVEQ